jgi:hypothetical protein
VLPAAPPPVRMTKNSLQRKRMTQAKAKTVTAWGAAPDALPAVKCVRLMKDAGRVLHDAIETLLPALTTTTTPSAKNKAEKKLRSALQLVSHFLETHGPSLHKSITSLASAATVRACEMKIADEHTHRLQTNGYRGFEHKQHEKRLRDLARDIQARTADATAETEPAAEEEAAGSTAEVGHNTTSNQPGMPDIPVEGRKMMARVGVSRACSVKSDSPVQHPQPIRGPDSQYDPKILQVIIRKYICPTGTRQEWTGARGKRSELRKAIIFWLERGWIGASGRILMTKDSDGKLTTEAEKAYQLAHQTIQRHYRMIEAKGWSIKLRWWGDRGRPRLLTAAEARQQCDQLHAAGFDVEVDDWEDMLMDVKQQNAVATGTEDHHCVESASRPTVAAYMRSQDLRTDEGRTVTGTTSSESQTLVREDAGQSIRAAVCLVATALFSGYNPIDPNHARYKEHAKTMTDTDRLVEEVAGRPMLPVDNHLLTSTDATTTFVQLSTGPSENDFVGQRQASARTREQPKVDESPVERTAEQAAANAAAMQVRLNAAMAATPATMLVPEQNGTPIVSAFADTRTTAAPLKPCHGSKRNATKEARRAKKRGDQPHAAGFKTKSMHSFVRYSYCARNGIVCTMPCPDSDLCCCVMRRVAILRRMPWATTHPCGRSSPVAAVRPCVFIEVHGLVIRVCTCTCACVGVRLGAHDSTAHNGTARYYYTPVRKCARPSCNWSATMIPHETNKSGIHLLKVEGMHRASTTCFCCCCCCCCCR